MATGTSRDDLQSTVQATKQQASSAVSDATESVKSTLTQQKDTYAGSMKNFAGALRKAARESGGDGQGVGGMANWAADGLERASSTLRSKDLNGMMREVESFARQQPVAFFAAAAALGFLATRFLKAGSPSGGETSSPARSYPPAGDGAATTDLSNMTRV